MPGTIRQLTRGLGLFDAFVLAGAATNVVVIMILFGYWLTH